MSLIVSFNLELSRIPFSEATMLAERQPERIDLPKGWQRCVSESWRDGCFIPQSQEDVCHSPVE